MQNLNVENLPNKGYVVSIENKKEEFYKNESHIHKQGPLSGVKAELHKISNDIFTYFPKGFQGSKNSDFYEFLSLGKIPNLIGSVMLIGLYSFANNKFNAKDANSAAKTAKCFGAGVVLYAIGKWLNKKIAHTGIKAATGIDLDLRYINKVNELPEPGQDKGIVRTQYPGVYDSVDFYRRDLLAKDAELNHDDMYYHDDIIAKKAGYGEKSNAANQIATQKIREVKTRTTALENITSYIVAATGVALGSQKAFENLKLGKGQGIIKNIKTTLNSVIESFPNAIKQLWRGNNRNIITKNYGKALMFGSLLATLATLAIPIMGFKSNPDTMKSKVDDKKEYEVC